LGPHPNKKMLSIIVKVLFFTFPPLF